MRLLRQRSFYEGYKLSEGHYDFLQIPFDVVPKTETKYGTNMVTCDLSQFGNAGLPNDNWDNKILTFRCIASPGDEGTSELVGCDNRIP